MGWFSDIAAGGSVLIAGWAGWTAHRARAWQRERDDERRQTNVVVSFEHSAAHLPATLSYEHAEPLRLLRYVLTVVVRNDGESPEWLSRLCVQQPHGDEDVSGRLGYDLFDEAKLARGDRQIRPRERIATTVDVDSLGFDLSQGVVGIAWLASGAEVRSAVEHLEPDLVAHVDGHNQRQ